MYKAIQTAYKGYLFRSRTEARWAMFFDALGVKYRYEVEGYDLNGLWYLPDFWLPDLKYWIEIKGIKPTGIEEEKARRLCHMHGGDMVFIFTSPWYTEGALAYTFIPDNLEVPNDPHLRERLYMAHVAETADWFWCECPVCGNVGVTADGNPAPLHCYCVLDKVLNTLDKRDDGSLDGGQLLERLSKIPRTAMTPRLVRAYTVARQARFEHKQ